MATYVADLRGSDTPPKELLDQLQALKKSVGTKAHWLLILGDDKMLDEVGWLKLDREKSLIKRNVVTWLSDDELPPSKDNQIRLMMKLTELGVPLAAEKEKGAN